MKDRNMILSLALFIMFSAVFSVIFGFKIFGLFAIYPEIILLKEFKKTKKFYWILLTLPCLFAIAYGLISLLFENM